MLEEYGLGLITVNVASSWLRYIPAGRTFTAEKAAYKILLSLTDDATACLGLPPGFDLSACSMNEWADWIGTQIRVDMHGWVCPGRPDLAAHLARQDAMLSHRDDGVEGAAFIASLGALIPATDSILDAVESALKEIHENSGAFEAVNFGISIAGKDDAVILLHNKYKDYPAVHVLNNLSLVVWAVLTYEDDFSAAIGETVAAGFDTDCNGATVGGILGLTGKPIPEHWTKPWKNKVAVDFAGVGQLDLDELVDRTLVVAGKI